MLFLPETLINTWSEVRITLIVGNSLPHHTTRPWFEGRISHTVHKNAQLIFEHSGLGNDCYCQRFSHSGLVAQENAHPTYDKNIPAGHHGSTSQKLE
jgi:hypothetical protein